MQLLTCPSVADKLPDTLQIVRPLLRGRLAKGEPKPEDLGPWYLLIWDSNNVICQPDAAQWALTASMLLDDAAKDPESVGPWIPPVRAAQAHARWLVARRGLFNAESGEPAHPDPDPKHWQTPAFAERELPENVELLRMIADYGYRWHLMIWDDGCAMSEPDPEKWIGDLAELATAADLGPWQPPIALVGNFMTDLAKDLLRERDRRGDDRAGVGAR